MKVCFPVKNVQELESEVYGHFGSAPVFILVDTEKREPSRSTIMISITPKVCASPLRALGAHEIDCVVVGGIGSGALMKLIRQDSRL